MSLDTLSNVKARLNITASADDALLTTLMAAADAWVENYCNRDFAGGNFLEEFPGGSAFVCLRNFPVEELGSVRVDPARQFGTETILSTDSYVLHAERGVVQSVVGPFLPAASSGLVNAAVRTWPAGPKVVRVEYSTLTTVPDDVKAAYARLVAAWYRQAKTETAAGFVNVSQQKFGESFVIYGPASGGIPEDVIALLAPSRVPLV